MELCYIRKGRFGKTAQFLSAASVRSLLQGPERLRDEAIVQGQLAVYNRPSCRMDVGDTFNDIAYEQ